MFVLMSHTIDKLQKSRCRSDKRPHRTSYTDTVKVCENRVSALLSLSSFAVANPPRLSITAKTGTILKLRRYYVELNRRNADNFRKLAFTKPAKYCGKAIIKQVQPRTKILQKFI